jgi:hypothetical protein
MGIKDLGGRRSLYLRKLMERTRGNCGSLKQLVAAGMRMTHRAKVARRREHGFSETRKRRYCTENPERMDVQDEMLEGPGMQNRNKGSRHKTAAAS